MSEIKIHTSDVELDDKIQNVITNALAKINKDTGYVTSSYVAVVFDVFDEDDNYLFSVDTDGLPLAPLFEIGSEEYERRFEASN